MTQEEKNLNNLLLKDLCARLPYKIRCSYYDICLLAHCNGEIYGIENKEYAIVDGKCIAIGFIKPYLLPMSSMTEEQKKEEYEICKYYLNGYESKLIDFYNKNHLDYRGLIPKGLAIDATNLNIY